MMMDLASFVFGLIVGMVLPFGVAPLFRQLRKAYEEIMERT